MGSERFQRVFVRADSGQLASGTAFFVSASDTRANKWRGDGQAQLKIVGPIHFRYNSDEYGAREHSVARPDGASLRHDSAPQPPSIQRRLALDLGD